MTVAVLVPVLDRPHRVRPFLESLTTSFQATKATPVFICSPGDDAEHAAVVEQGHEPVVVDWPAGPGDWARKLNHAFARTDATWMLLGADDLAFRRGWIERCLACHRRTRACVIGTNDLGNSRVMSGLHSTHPLVHRDYLECGTVDEAGKVVCELYGHQFADDELVQTARWRGTYAPARDAYVEHLHPDWGKAARDATYDKGLASFHDDRAIYQSRKHMWGL